MRETPEDVGMLNNLFFVTFHLYGFSKGYYSAYLSYSICPVYRFIKGYLFYQL